MLRIPFLRNLLLLSVLLAVALPLYAVLAVTPAYRQILTEETEGEAVRYVDALVRNLDLPAAPGTLSAHRLPPRLVAEVRALQGDPTLIKLRVFSPRGEIVLSSDPGEVGQRNDKPYFREVVAYGKPYSKVVRKGHFTAEGEVAEQTVVETYVPLMKEGVFLGAVETYFDVTVGRDRLNRLARRTTVLLFVIAGGLLTLIVFALRAAAVSITRQEAAEAALRQANLDLEVCVASRTEQVLESNRALTEEIAMRRRTEEALARTLATVEQTGSRTAAILRSIPDGLLVVDAAGKLVLLNPCAEAVLGLNFAQDIGRPLSTLLGDGRCSALQAALAAPESAEAGELVCDRQEPTRIFRVTSSPVVASDGSSLGRIFLLHEVTRERAAQQAKREFVAMAAHELNAPLMAIVGYADLLAGSELDPLEPERRREILDCIAEQSRILNRLVNDLLDLSRLESGQAPLLQRSYCTLEEIVQAAVTAARAGGSDRFELALPATATTILADRGRLLQVLANLLGNAAKFSPPGTPIRVLGDPLPDAYRVSIVDQGSGMTDEERRRAFETFYRGTSFDPAVRGSGLGLTIARTIVEAHGGSIGIDSIVGAGTRVWFTLPLVPQSRS